MRNICESPINVVNDNRPKMLTGLNQKVRGTDRAVRCCPAQPAIPPADWQIPSHSILNQRNTVSPYFSSCKQRQEAVRRTEGDAGKGCRRKRMPFCNETDNGSESAVT